jgi:hypothetical protein
MSKKYIEFRLGKDIRQFVKQKCELVMREELEKFLEIDIKYEKRLLSTKSRYAIWPD